MRILSDPQVVRLQAAADVHVTGLVHVEYSSPGPGSELHTSGSIRLHQAALLTDGTSYVDTEYELLRYNSSDPYELVCSHMTLTFGFVVKGQVLVVYHSSVSGSSSLSGDLQGPLSVLDMPEILRKDHSRDISLTFEQRSQTWKVVSTCLTVSANCENSYAGFSFTAKCHFGYLQAGIGPFKAVVDIIVPPVQPLLYRSASTPPCRPHSENAACQKCSMPEIDIGCIHNVFCLQTKGLVRSEARIRTVAGPFCRLRDPFLHI
jgi:hypothetical protein